MEWMYMAALVAAGFLSAFIDSIVGGGGLISLPAMLMTGLPPTTALGTNKLAAVTGVITSSRIYWQRGHVQKEKVKRWWIPTFLASMSGSYIVSRIPVLYLEPLIIAVLASVTAFVLLRKDWGTAPTVERKGTAFMLLTGVLVMAIGFYDGFIGPGTGTFMMFSFVALGTDFLDASGNARCLNMASNLGSLVFFMGIQQVHIPYGLAMAIGMYAGATAGSQMAIRKGAGFVRIVFITVTVGMILVLAYRYWGHIWIS